MAEHVMFAREASWGLYAPPTRAVAVETFNVIPNIDFMTVEDTGPGGRGRPAGAPGAISVAGTLAAKLYPQSLGYFIRSVMGTRSTAAETPADTGGTVTTTTIGPPTLLTTGAPHGLKIGDTVLLAGSTGATPPLNGTFIVTSIPSPTTFGVNVTASVAGTWSAGTFKRQLLRNKLAFNDDLAFDSFSFQKYYDSTHAEFLRGCKITSLGFSVRSREFAKFTMDFVGKDATKNGGTWADGTVAPAITPYTHSPTGPAGSYFYPPVLQDPLKFYQASLRIGGTVASTLGELITTGGTARTDIDNFACTIDLGLGTDAYGVILDDRTVQQIDEGARLINLTFEPNFKQNWFEFYDLWKANPQTNMVLEAIFRGPAIYGTTYPLYKFTFPNVRISSAPPPEQNAAYGLKRSSVAAQAAIDNAVATDMGLVIVSGEDYSV